jgi:hypothetical protein
MKSAIAIFGILLGCTCGSVRADIRGANNITWVQPDEPVYVIPFGHDTTEVPFAGIAISLGFTGGPTSSVHVSWWMTIGTVDPDLPADIVAGSGNVTPNGMGEWYTYGPGPYFGMSGPLWLPSGNYRAVFKFYLDVEQGGNVLLIHYGNGTNGPEFEVGEG